MCSCPSLLFALHLLSGPTSLFSRVSSAPRSTCWVSGGEAEGLREGGRDRKWLRAVAAVSHSLILSHTMPPPIPLSLFLTPCRPPIPLTLSHSMSSPLPLTLSHSMSSPYTTPTLSHSMSSPYTTHSFSLHIPLSLFLTPCRPPIPLSLFLTPCRSLSHPLTLSHSTCGPPPPPTTRLHPPHHLNPPSHPLPLPSPSACQLTPPSSPPPRYAPPACPLPLACQATAWRSRCTAWTATAWPSSWTGRVRYSPWWPTC